MSGRTKIESFGWIAIAVWCWFLFTWTHEFGHVLGAWLTDSGVDRVVLHPLAFGRTDVQPNKNPLIVVWAGPLLGIFLSAIVSLAWIAVSIRLWPLFLLGMGFSLLSNGTYIGTGAIAPAADTEVMVSLGTPRWILALFGLTAGSSGYVMCKRAVSSFRHWSEDVFRPRLICALYVLNTGFIFLGSRAFAGP